jgi:hypothetical protein
MQTLTPITLKVLQEIHRAHKYFTKSEFSPILESAEQAWESNDLEGCRTALGRLPSSDELLESLLKRLRGKSVFKTIQRMDEETDSLKTSIGLSSLITHVLIESKSNPEYKSLLHPLLEKLSGLLYKL